MLGQEGIKNRDFPFYFYFSLQNNNVGGSVNQSIIKKKGLRYGTILNCYCSLTIFKVQYEQINKKCLKQKSG